MGKRCFRMSLIPLNEFSDRSDRCLLVLCEEQVNLWCKILVPDSFKGIFAFPSDVRCLGEHQVFGNHCSAVTDESYSGCDFEQLLQI